MSSECLFHTVLGCNAPSMPPSGRPRWHRWATRCAAMTLTLALGATYGIAQTPGSKQSVSYSAQQLSDTYYSEGISIGDINADSINDVVYGPYWFAGPEFTEKHEIYAAKPQPTQAYADNFFSWVYDFDGDQKNDVFVVGFPGTPAYVYKNPGSDDGVWSKHQVFDWVSNESPHFVDVVGDERPELVCTRDGFFGYATINSSAPLSAWQFHPVSEKIAATRFGHGLGVGDVNSDGRNDIVYSGGWFEQPAADPAGRWRHHAAKLSGAYGGAEMLVYDVDGDGDSDIITSEAAHDFGLSWYEQTQAGGEVEFRQHAILGKHVSENKYGVLISELHSVTLADIDGDGLKDIVTGKTYWSHHKQSPMWDAGAVVYWFQLVRTPDGIDWIPRLIDGKSGIGRQVIVADINADGTPDVATGGMLGANIMLQTRRDVSSAEYAAQMPAVYAGPKLADVSKAVAMRGPRITVGADGKVPKAIEAENLNVVVSSGAAKSQPMQGFASGQWSGASQLWWTGGKPGDTLTIPLDVLGEVESLQMAMTAAGDYAVVELALDGKTISSQIDLYSQAVVSTGLLEFDAPLKPGKHKLTLTIVGANPKAKPSHMVGIDFLRFKAPGQTFDAPGEIRPKSPDGNVLNLDFESGTLADWEASGDAFTGRPVKGDAVADRRTDMSSQHVGDYWIGGFETAGDTATGSLTSLPFVASERYATFLVGGGSSEKTRVELWAVGESKPFYAASGKNSENLAEVIVDLGPVQDHSMFIRLVDESRTGWGHLNFDHFRLHANRPGPVTPQTKVLAADEYPHSGLDAEAAAAAMQVPEGFRVTVCAAEPAVKQPIAMAIDDRGRTWIAEAYEYPVRAKGDTGRDRILIFEDTTGDGKFDSRKIFAEGLNLVSGLEIGHGGVWVGAAPYLMFIPDANGDDVPDAKPQILLDGWGYEDTHETLNAFCWGPDGWLYGCHGVFTHSNVGKPGATDAERTRINAGVWRYHPTQHKFDVLAHGTSNPWGVDFNEYGDAFVTACVIPHLFHMIPEARYHRQGGQHFNKHTYGDIKTIADHLHYLGATPHSGNGKSDEAGGGHAHAGAMIYQGGLWPEKYHGKLFMNNIHGQRLNVDALEPQGSGYVGHHDPDFLLTGDLASQILNMRYGPDGQVTFIDWYDMQACHRKEVEVHDRSNGRIYKLSYGDTKPVVVNLATSSDAELAEFCLNKNEWYVRHARRLLAERASKGGVDSAAAGRLRDILSTHPEATRRLRAGWALHATGQMQAEDYLAMLSDSSPYVQVWAMRLFVELQNFQLNEHQLEYLASLASQSESPVVRREIASVLCKLPAENRWAVAEALVQHAEDADDHNLPLLYWYAIEPLAEADPDRALELGMTAGEHIPLLRQYMLRRVAGSGGEQAIERLVEGLLKSNDVGIQANFLDAIRNSLAGSRTAKMPAAWPAAFKKLASTHDGQLSFAAATIGVVFGDAAAADTLRGTVGSSDAPVSQRKDAIAALLAINDSSLASSLIQIIQQANADGSLVEDAIRGLAQYDAPNIAPAIVEAYPRLTAAQRRSAIATLSSRVSNASTLLDAIEQETIPASDLSADMARQIEYLNDADLSKQLAQSWGQVRESSAEKAQLIAKYRELIASKEHPAPNVELGRAIFAKTCQRCHMLYGVGEKLGPDLTGSNRSNLEYVLENIVDPSAVMAKEYRQSVLLTDSGQVITGILLGETAKAVTIQTADATVIVPLEEIEERMESEMSMMPDNQLKQFSDHEIRSLIAYLRGKKQNPIQATTENAVALFNGADLTGWSGNPDLWSVVGGEIVGNSDGLDKNEFLVSDLSASDFRLSLEIKLVDNAGNSGIQLRSVARDDGSVEGYQADAGAGWWGKLYEEHGRGLLWEQSGEAHLKSGDWNTYEIEAIGAKTKTWINGQLCVDLDDDAGRKSGIFAIQLHSGGPTEIRVRNIKLDVK